MIADTAFRPIRPLDAAFPWSGAKSKIYTNSFNPLNGTSLTTFLAGLALKTVSSFVKGLMPFRSGVAGLRTTLIFRRLEMLKLPAPCFTEFLLDEFGKFLEQTGNLLLGQTR